MLSRSVLTDLLTTHVLDDDETITTFDEQEDRTAVATEHRSFVVTYEPDRWAIGEEPWVSDFVVATRDDLRVHGQPERFAFVVPTGAQEIYVNDVDALGRLGADLHDDLDPAAYAELLVQFHPYTSALRNLLIDRDDLRQIFALDGLPDVEPLEVDRDGDVLTLAFQSCVRYRRPGTLALLDIYDWEVTVPAGGPATWTSELIDEAIPLQ